MTRPVPIFLAVLCMGSTHAEILYRTDFDSFPTGDNSWAGFDGWVSRDTTSGAQAIDDGLFSGALGKTAALGFNRPNEAFTFVAKSIGYDPATGGNPLLEFQMLFGIEDSTILTNFRRDDFFFSFYNNAGDFLATIRISNVDTEFGFWRQNGNLQEGGTETDTGQEFVHGELHNLSGTINLETNRWSAAVDGIPLFENVVFNGTGKPRTLGAIGIEWLVAGGSPQSYGDNWMLVADLRIETIEEPAPEVVIESIELLPPAGLRLSWQAFPGYTYQVEYSTDLETWLTGLPGSVKPAPPVAQTYQFTDSSGVQPSGRYYRIRQSPVP